MMDNGFWAALDKLASVCEIRIDRPKGSRHPNWPDLVYPLDYGYLEGTKSGDGNEIDAWVGSLPERHLTAVAVIVDLHKRDSEIKLLFGCNDDEIAVVLALHNTGAQSGLVLKRSLTLSDNVV